MTAAHAALTRALQLSETILAIAEKADLRTVATLDAERLQLLKSFRSEQRLVTAPNRALLDQIKTLNDRTLGLMEHRRRAKGREVDMAAVGRRAVAAYASVRVQR